ncbi:MAG TPA: glutamyl-tRNA reductase [Gaiellales bacterium]|jgi:glutamyl-tRNA reductase
MTDGVQIVALGVDHTTADSAARERIAAAWDAAVSEVVAGGAALSVVALRTCLRVEAYFLTADPAGCAAALSARSGDAHLRARTGRAAVAHLFSVAGGLESMIVGERQILDQTRAAWELARARGRLDARLDRMFQHAVAVGKRVRRDTDICRGGSVADAAADLVVGYLGDVGAAAVAIVGAGAVSRKVAVVLGRRGVRDFTVTNRSPDRAAALAAELDRRGWMCAAVPWERRTEATAAAAVVMCATSAPGPVLGVRDLADGRPRLVVDLALPRDVDAGVGCLAGTRLVNLDAVWRHAPDRSPSAPAELAQARSIVDDWVDAYMRWLAERKAAPTIAELMRRTPRAGSNPSARRALHAETIALKRRAAETHASAR